MFLTYVNRVLLPINLCLYRISSRLEGREGDFRFFVHSVENVRVCELRKNKNMCMKLF